MLDSEGLVIVRLDNRQQNANISNNIHIIIYIYIILYHIILNYVYYI